MFETIISPIEVGVHYGVPSFGAVLGNRRSELAASIVHKKINFAVFSDGVFHQSFDLQHQVRAKNFLCHNYVMNVYVIMYSNEVYLR